MTTEPNVVSPPSLQTQAPSPNGPAEVRDDIAVIRIEARGLTVTVSDPVGAIVRINDAEVDQANKGATEMWLIDQYAHALHQSQTTVNRTIPSAGEQGAFELDATETLFAVRGLRKYMETLGKV